MSEKSNHNFNAVPSGCTPYGYGDLSFPFTPENTSVVNSVMGFLSESEIVKLRDIKTIYYISVHQAVIGTSMPGLRSYGASFCLYFRKYREVDYYDLLKEFMGAACAGHLDLNPDTVHWDWFRVITPGGDRYYPLESTAISTRGSTA